MTYAEPQLTFLVLSFLKETDTRLCLESIKRNALFPHKVTLLHNGPSDYPIRFYDMGLVDTLIQTKENHGLGVGTRDLVASCFSPFFCYFQNDQILGREWTQQELDAIIETLGSGVGEGEDEEIVASISIAGPVGAPGRFSERAHVMETIRYKQLESDGLLGYHGAGPYHDGEWREASIQREYREGHYTHLAWPHPLVIDNGRSAVRQNPDGSIWQHEPDRKGLRLLKGPVKERFVYPKLTDAEWTSVLETQSWPDGKIPSQEVKDSFHVWN